MPELPFAHTFALCHAWEAVLCLIFTTGTELRAGCLEVETLCWVGAKIIQKRIKAVNKSYLKKRAPTPVHIIVAQPDETKKGESARNIETSLQRTLKKTNKKNASTFRHASLNSSSSDSTVCCETWQKRCCFFCVFFLKSSPGLIQSLPGNMKARCELLSASTGETWSESTRRSDDGGGGRLINALCCRHARKKKNPYPLSPERTEPPVSVRFRQAVRVPQPKWDFLFWELTGLSHCGVIQAYCQYAVMLKATFHDKLPWE